MACVLPFNQISIDGVVVASPSDFIYGSGSLTLSGQDSAITTADGQIHNYRAALTPSARCEFRGDARSKDTGAPASWDGQTWPCLSGTVKLEYIAKRGEAATVVRTFAGLVSCEYDSNQNKTSANITGCETVY
jgi:hypothetical protein